MATVFEKSRKNWDSTIYITPSPLGVEFHADVADMLPEREVGPGMHTLVR